MVNSILQKMLENDDSGVDLSRVAFALGKVGGPESVPVLVDCLNSPDPSLQIQAVIALGELGDSRAVHPLGTRLMIVVEHDETMLASIIAALQQIGDTNALQYLKKAANGKDSIASELSQAELADERTDSERSDCDACCSGTGKGHNRGAQ